MKFIKYFLILILLVNMNFLYSQNLPKYIQSGVIRVVDRYHVPLHNPFAGGLVYPVFASMDLNSDGKQDLVVLDRADEQITTYINQSEDNSIMFLFTPYYEKYFPDTLSRFIYLQDYNLDGKKDLISYATFNPSGFEVFKNTGAGTKIRFERVTDQIQTRAGWDTSLIYNLYVTRTDLAAVTDLDYDGDLDIFTYDALGGAWLEYYQNMSQEWYGNSDSLVFSKNDEYWGYVMEDESNNGVYLGYVRTWYYKHYKTEKKNNLNLEKRHAGSTCLIEDLDGDRDKDVLVADVGYPGIIFLKNGKSEYNTHYDTIISFITHWPPSKPVKIRQMPGIFYLDITGDNVRDLVFSPMDESLADTIQSLQHIWLYKNMGTDSNLVPAFVMSDFLVDQMIYTGGATSPAFFDFDSDGDEDLFVVTKGSNPWTEYKHDHIFLYENIGKKDSNIFMIKDTNYMNLYAAGYENMSVAFGDIDGDGVKDMLLGNKAGKFNYYHNSALPGQTASFNLTAVDFQGITIPGGYSTAAIACISNDSLPDIIAGGYYGRLFYYKNTGTKLNPVFTLENDTFCGINIPKGEHYAAPAIADLDTNGRLDLVLAYDIRSQATGIYYSNLNFYYNITDNPDSTYLPRDTMIAYFENGILSKSTRPVGKLVKPALSDLDGDGLPDIVLGSQRGGLMFYGSNTSCVTKIVPQGSTVLCSGDSLKLDAGDGFDSYNWNTGETTRFITVKTGGNYSCLVAKGALNYTANITVTSHTGTIKADFLYTRLAANLTYRFETGNTYIDSIYWNFGDGVSSNLLNPVHTYPAADTYTVCMYVRDSCGASDTKCQKMKATSLKDKVIPKIAVYPNPFNTELYISTDPSESADLIFSITDLTGKTKKELLPRTDVNVINTSALNNGIYLISITDRSGKVKFRKKFIKM